VATDATTDFLARLKKEEPRAAAIHELSIDALKALGAEVGAIGGDLPLAFLDGDQRAELEGERPLDTFGILLSAASAMRDTPDVAETIGATPELLEDVASQGIALRGLLVRAEDVERSGRDGALLISGEIDTRCRTVIGHLTARAGTTEGGMLRSSFAAPLRLMEELQANQARAALGTERRLAPARDRLQRARDTAAALGSINQFLGHRDDAGNEE
jgi:hypothetical protein